MAVLILATADTERASARSEVCTLGTLLTFSDSSSVPRGWTQGITCASCGDVVRSCSVPGAGSEGTDASS